MTTRVEQTPVGRTRAGRPVRFVAAGLLAILALAGCTDRAANAPNGRTTDGSTMTTPATVRTDRGPLTKRFPKLGDFIDAHWVGEAAGSDTGGVPGPTDVVIVGFVQLRLEDLATAKSGYQWVAATPGWESGVRAEVHPYLPAGGDWRMNDQYSSEVRTGAYSGTVYLDLVSGTVYLELVST